MTNESWILNVGAWRDYTEILYVHGAGDNASMEETIRNIWSRSGGNEILQRSVLECCEHSTGRWQCETYLPLSFFLSSFSAAIVGATVECCAGETG